MISVLAEWVRKHRRPEPKDEVEFAASQVIEFAELAMTRRRPSDLQRLAGMYSASLGAAVDGGKQTRLCIAVRIVAAFLPDLRTAKGERQIKLRHMLLGVLTIDAGEPAFERLVWSDKDTRAVQRKEGRGVLAHLASRAGAFGGGPDYKIRGAIDKAMNREHWNAKRRKKKKEQDR
jgi:hypothetical protein